MKKFLLTVITLVTLATNINSFCSVQFVIINGTQLPGKIRVVTTCGDSTIQNFQRDILKGQRLEEGTQDGCDLHISGSLNDGSTQINIAPFTAHISEYGVSLSIKKGTNGYSIVKI